MRDTNGVGIPNVKVETYGTNHCYCHTTTSAEAGSVGIYKLYLLPGTYSLQIKPPPEQFPPFEIKKLHISGDTIRNITLSYEYTILDEAIALISPDLELHLDVFDVIDQGSYQNYDVMVPTPRDKLQLIVNWEGSLMQVDVYKPDGSNYGQYQSDTPPIIIDILNPEVGTWTCEVTAIVVPYDNYPIALVAGISPNEPPVAYDQSVATDEDIAIPITLTASDPEGNALTYRIIGNPPNGVLSGVAPDLIYTPNPDFSGYDSFTFRTNDGEMDSNLATVNITVNPVNDPPVANGGPDQSNVPVGPDCMASVTLEGSGSSDSDGDPLTYTWTWDGGSATGMRPTINLPLGTHMITLVVNDGTVDSDPDSVDITVIDDTLPTIQLSDPECVNVGKGKRKMANKLTVSATDNCVVESLTIDKVEIFNNDGKLVKGKGIYEIVGNDIYVCPKGKGWSICVTAIAVDVNGNSTIEERICKTLLKCKKDKYKKPASFIIEKAKIDFKKKPYDDKIYVKGKFVLGKESDGVKISEDVIVTIGPFTETIKMEEKDKSRKWEYKRPKDETGIKHMTIHWKYNEGKFDIHVDKADLGEMSDWPNPLTITILIGNDKGTETIQMKEHKHYWDYNR